MKEGKAIKTTTRYLLKVKKGWFSHFIVFLNSCASMKSDYYCETKGVFKILRKFQPQHKKNFLWKIHIKESKIQLKMGKDLYS